MRISDTSDLWWKTAVIYCLDVQTFMDWNDDGMGDFTGPGRAPRLPRRARGDLPVADAVLPDDGPRRRLRHHRLLRGRPAARQCRRLRRGGPHRPRPRHAGDHRPGRQPHLRPAPLVPGGAVEQDLAVPRLLRLARPTSRRTPRRRSSFPDQENSIWEYDEKTGGVVPAPLLPDPARPQHHQPPGPRRDRQGDGLLARARDLRLPGGRRAVHARDRPASTQAELEPVPRPPRVPAPPAVVRRAPYR